MIGCGRVQVPIPTGDMGTSCMIGKIVKPSHVYHLLVMHSPHQLACLWEFAPEQVLPPPMGLGWPGQQPVQLVQPPQPLHLLHLPPVHALEPECAASIL